jgi:chromate reductase
MRNEVMEPFNIVGISGSLRKASFNTEILKVLAKESAPVIQLHMVTLEDIPLFNEDLDTTKVVLAVNVLKRLIPSCDGVLISTPEYNHGIPGVLKNALTGCSVRTSSPVSKTNRSLSSVP